MHSQINKHFVEFYADHKVESMPDVFIAEAWGISPSTLKDWIAKGKELEETNQKEEQHLIEIDTENNMYLALYKVKKRANSISKMNSWKRSMITGKGLHANILRIKQKLDETDNLEEALGTLEKGLIATAIQEEVIKQCAINSDEEAQKLRELINRQRQQE